MKNKDKRRMTRAEKIEAARLLNKKGLVEDPRMLKDLQPGTYTVTGRAAVVVGRSCGKKLG